MKEMMMGDWNIATGNGTVLLYTLKQDGWRKGEPVMVNDMTARLDSANGSNNDLVKCAYRFIAADDMYNALWEVVELSDRTLPPSGRTAECQRVYDLCRAALKRAEGDA